MSMRISGLASGLDTDDIIKKLMSAQRIPLEKMNQQKQILEWRRDEYRSLNTKVMAFRDSAFNMKVANYNTKTAVSSNSNAVSVSAGDAMEGQHTLRVNQLATAATYTTGNLKGEHEADRTMSDLGISAGDEKIVINGKEFAFKSTDTLTKVLAEINQKSSETGVRVTHDSTMDRLFFTSTKTGENAKVDFSSSSAEVRDAFKINPALALQESTIIDSGVGANQALKINVDGVTHSFDITDTTTAGGLRDAISSITGLTASIDNSGRLRVVSNDGHPISFSDTNKGALSDKLGLSGASFGDIVTGKNAEVVFNGVNASYESNTFTVTGITFTAKQVTDTPINVTVSKDTDTAFNMVKDFVDKYNELIDTVNGKLTEKRHRDFFPLTDEQRKEMSEDEIKKWEEKAMSGMLRNDQLLSGGLGSLRTSLSGTLSALPAEQLRSLAEIGISSTLVTGTVVSGSYQDQGKLYIDETKLRKALSDRPDEVKNLFAADDRDPNSTAGDGIATRLHQEATNLISKITNKAGASSMADDRYVMGKELQQYDKRVETLTRRLSDMENRYYKQFSAMETYLNRMNSQSAWLAQQFSTGG